MIAATGTVVHLEGYGVIRVFRIVAKDGTTEHWATSDLPMGELERLRLADASWRVELFFRWLKCILGCLSVGLSFRRANPVRP